MAHSSGPSLRSGCAVSGHRAEQQGIERVERGRERQKERERIGEEGERKGEIEDRQERGGVCRYHHCKPFHSSLTLVMEGRTALKIVWVGMLLET